MQQKANPAKTSNQVKSIAPALTKTNPTVMLAMGAKYQSFAKNENLNPKRLAPL